MRRRAEVDPGDANADLREAVGVESGTAGNVEEVRPGFQPQPGDHALDLRPDLGQPAAGGAVALIEVLAQHPLAKFRVVPREIAAVLPGDRRRVAVVNTSERGQQARLPACSGSR